MIKRNIKMVVTPEESKQVQEICFANGITWNTGYFEVQHLHSKYLFINKVCLTYCDTKEFFKDKGNEEVSANLFIKTKGTCIEEAQEQELEQNIKEEQMKDNEVETYKDVKEYLVAKGLYDRVMNIEWNGTLIEWNMFSDLFMWDETIEGYNYWDEIDDTLFGLNINEDTESLVQDYKTKQGEEFIQHLETQPEEVVDEAPEQPTEAKPKQYLCYVQGKALPKHIHKTLEQAKQEAQRLCRKELAKVSVLEVVAEYEAEVLVKEVL